MNTIECSTSHYWHNFYNNGQDADVVPPDRVASIIESSGFDRPVLFLQTLFVRTWYAKRSSILYARGYAND